MKLFCPICRKPIADTEVEKHGERLLYSDYCGDCEVRITITPVWKPKEAGAK